MINIEKLECDLIAFLHDNRDPIPNAAVLLLHACQCAIRQLDDRLAAERGLQFKLREALDREIEKRTPPGGGDTRRGRCY